METVLNTSVADSSSMSGNVYSRIIAQSASFSGHGASAVPEDVFGPRTMLAEMSSDGFIQPQLLWTELTDNVLYKALVIACFVALCYMVWYFRGYISTTLSSVWNRSTLEKQLSDQSSAYGKYMNLIRVSALMILGVLILRFTDSFFALDVPSVTGAFTPYIAVAVAAAVAAVFLYQHLILAAAGSITGRRGVTATLTAVRRQNLAVATTILFPLTLLFSVYYGRGAAIISTMIIAAVLVSYIFLIIRTYTFFNNQKISILVWILYLCAVEIFPVSFILLLVMKNT